MLIKPEFFPTFFPFNSQVSSWRRSEPFEGSIFVQVLSQSYCFERNTSKLKFLDKNLKYVCQYNAAILVRPQTRKFILYRLSWCQKSFWNKYFLNLSWILKLKLFNFKCKIPPNIAVVLGMLRMCGWDRRTLLWRYQYLVFSIYWLNSRVVWGLWLSILMWRNAHQTPAVNSILD